MLLYWQFAPSHLSSGNKTTVDRCYVPAVLVECTTTFIQANVDLTTSLLSDYWR